MRRTAPDRADVVRGKAMTTSRGALASLASLLSVLALAAGCKQKDAAPAGGGPATPPSPVSATPPAPRPPATPPGPRGTPRPQPKLTVTVDGKPVTMATALAWKDWDGTIKLTASTVPVACDEVTGEMRALHDGELTFAVTAAYGLQPDGSRKGEVRATYFSGMSSQRTAPAALTGDGTPGAPTTVDVDFTTRSMAFGKEPAQELVVKGTIDALGCATRPRADLPPLPPPMDATIEVAGVKLPVRGARFGLSGGTRSLELFTGGEGCKQVAFQAPSELEVRFVWFDDKPEVRQLDLDGSLVGPHADQTFDKKKVSVSPNPTAAGEFTVNVDAKIMGYPVKVTGKVTAVECK